MGTEVPSDLDNVFRFSVDMQLLRPGGEFQICRNRDFEQVLYPLEEASDSTVGGPDDESDGRAWLLNGKVGDRFRIEMTRSRRNGCDEKHISWTCLGNEALTDQQAREAQRACFAVFGSWDDGN